MQREYVLPKRTNKNMTQITGIGFSNFRVFSKPTFFDLAPISIFTGTNSSGKSSVFKGLLLMNNNARDLKHLDFSGYHHKLGTFGNTISYGSRKNVVEYAFKYNTKGVFFDNYSLSLQYEPSKADNEGGTLSNFFITGGGETYPEKTKLLIVSSRGVKLKFTYLLEKLKLTILPRYKAAYEAWLANPEESGFVEVGDILKLKPSNKPNEKVEALLNFSGGIVNLAKLADNLPTLSDYKLGVIADLMSDTVLEFFSDDNDYDQEAYTNEIKANEPDVFDVLTQDILFKFSEADISYNLFVDKIKDTGIHFEQSEREEINNLILNLEFKELLTPEFKSILKILRDELTEILNTLNTSLVEIDYIEAVRANQQRLYTNESQGTSFNELLLKLGRSINPIVSGKDEEPGISFVQTWLKAFKIGDSIKITRRQGVVTEVTITKDDREVNLADLGFGVTQFLPILLNIAANFTMKGHYHYVNSATVDNSQKVIENPNGPLLLIEEPESNLHPKLQSLLADFFVDVAKNYKVTLLIETHSEYFIRRLQVLTADPQKELQPKDTVIHYLNGSLPAGSHGFAKKINITPDGSLTDEFGTGFIDEATNWKIELMRLKNSHLYNVN